MSEDLIAIVHRGMEAWNAHDVDVFVAVAHPEALWRPGSTSALSGSFIRGRPWFGLEEGLRAAQALAESQDPS